MKDYWNADTVLLIFNWQAATSSEWWHMSTRSTFHGVSRLQFFEKQVKSNNVATVT